MRCSCEVETTRPSAGRSEIRRLWFGSCEVDLRQLPRCLVGLLSLPALLLVLLLVPIEPPPWLEAPVGSLFARRRRPRHPPRRRSRTAPGGRAGVVVARRARTRRTLSQPSLPLAAPHGSPPLAASHSAPPLVASHGALPLAASHGAPPLAASHGAQPLASPHGGSTSAPAPHATGKSARVVALARIKRAASQTPARESSSPVSRDDVARKEWGVLTTTSNRHIR